MAIWLKRIGYTIGAIVALILIVVSFVYGMSERRFRRTYSVAAEQVTPSSDSATVTRGAHLALIVGCVDCHSEGLKGRAVFDAPPMGRLVSPNLTRGEGGVGATLTAAAIERAVRHGVGRDGRPLRIMPSVDYQYLSDDDVRAIASYAQSVSPANNVLAPSKLMLLPRALMVAGQLPLLSAETIAVAPATPMSVPPGATPEYGGYLTIVAGCRFCHGPGLSGGKIVGGDPSWVAGANITRGGNIGRWTEAQFVETLRTGMRPDGSPLKDPMPWKQIGQMSDLELRAVWLYLQSVPAKEFGGR